MLDQSPLRDWRGDWIIQSSLPPLFPLPINLSHRIVIENTFTNLPCHRLVIENTFTLSTAPPFWCPPSAVGREARYALLIWFVHMYGPKHGGLHRHTLTCPDSGRKCTLRNHHLLYARAADGHSTGTPLGFCPVTAVRNLAAPKL